MKMVEVGGLNLSKLTLGTCQLGMKYGIANKIGKLDDQAVRALLQESDRGGIHCFDTAEGYEASERLLGDYYSERKERPMIISKMKIAIDGNATFTDLRRQMSGLLENSLNRLKLAKVPGMLLHQPAILEKHGEWIGRICRELQKEGLVGKWGVSFEGNSEEQFRSIWPIVQDDLYEVVQIPINILDQRLIRAGRLQQLQQAGKIVFARSAFLQGMLFLEEHEIPGYLQEAVGALRLFRSIAEELGISASELAVVYVRDLPSVHSVVIGAETVEQVRANIGLIAAPALTEETRKRINRMMPDLSEDILNPAKWLNAIGR